MTNYSDLNEQEMITINQLRSRFNGDMEPELYKDAYVFLRFLRARDFNLDSTETMLRKHLQWREINDIKNILEFKKTEIMKKYCPYDKIGYDKDGCVVRYFQAGNLDARGILASIPLKDAVKLVHYELERDIADLKLRSQKMGRNIDKGTFIFDCENISFGVATDKKVLYIVMNMVSMLINNYPDRLKKLFIINASSYFYMGYNIVKILLPKVVLDKLQIYSDDSYKKELLTLIDADILPAFLGGNKKDPDGNPLCLTFIKRAEQVPRSFYMSEAKKALAKASDVRKITLLRAAYKEINIEVNDPGSFLEWEFETKSRDVGFGVFYQELVNGKVKMREMVSIQRIHTDEYPETGTFKCDQGGVYVIVFDNTYSWIREKEVYYRIRVVSPKESTLNDENVNNFISESI